MGERAMPTRPLQRTCSMGYATRDVIAHFRKLHPEVPEEEAHNLQANPDTSSPLYFWQLYSLLGQDRIVGIVRNLYTRIYADAEEPWLPHAFTRISGMDHHIATQAAFWLDAMGRGKCYHGGEFRLNFHHQHNAAHVMTQVGAARWMHHMRLALNESDLGPDPRVRATIDVFLQARMEKYAQQHAFQTGDRVYKAWNSEDWVLPTLGANWAQSRNSVRSQDGRASVRLMRGNSAMIQHLQVVHRHRPGHQRRLVLRLLIERRPFELWVCLTCPLHIKLCTVHAFFQRHSFSLVGPALVL